MARMMLEEKATKLVVACHSVGTLPKEQANTGRTDGFVREQISVEMVDAGEKANGFVVDAANRAKPSAGPSY